VLCDLQLELCPRGFVKNLRHDLTLVPGAYAGVCPWLSVDEC
jgi:hypothetical protein